MMTQEPTNDVTPTNESVGFYSLNNVNYGVRWKDIELTWDNYTKTWDESIDTVSLTNINI